MNQPFESAFGDLCLTCNKYIRMVRTCTCHKYLEIFISPVIKASGQSRHVPVIKTKVITTKYGKIALVPCPDAVNQSYYKSCIP